MQQRPQLGFKPCADAARTQPLHMTQALYRLGYRGAPSLFG